MEKHSDNEERNSVIAPAIPSVDLGKFLDGSPDEQKVIAANVDTICTNVGFLVIENHGVADVVVDDAWRAARSFFDSPLENKIKAQSGDPSCPRGYFPMASEALAKSLGVNTPPDLKESFGIGPIAKPGGTIDDDDFDFHFGENLWPSHPPEIRAALTRYFEAMTVLGSQVLRLFARALELSPDYFERFHTDPMCALRCINYPEQALSALPDQRGAGEHSDYGSITLLKSDPDVPGLEIRLPNGQWAKAPLVGDAFIVNIGDMMARWTNDRWVSTLHRVVQETDADGLARRRQSLAFFHNTSFDAEIRCIPTCLAEGQQPQYGPVQAGRYLKHRFSAAVN